MNSVRVILVALVIFLAVILGIEYFYGKDKCCKCCEIKQTTCGNEVCEKEVCTSGCCRCSFIKEYFKIDIYFWE